MLSIDIRHPDVEKFINIKKDLSKVTGANISILVRDDFMEAVKADKDYILRWPCNNEVTEDAGSFGSTFQINEKNEKTIVKRVKAKEVWNQIIESAHTCAEPGILFVDKHWEYSPDTVYPTYKGITTNP